MGEAGTKYLRELSRVINPVNTFIKEDEEIFVFSLFKT